MVAVWDAGCIAFPALDGVHVLSSGDHLMSRLQVLEAALEELGREQGVNF